MKKWIIAALLLIFIILAGIYFFIPSKLIIKDSVMLNANQNAASRHLINYTLWEAWWPGERPLHYNDHNYVVKPIAMDATEITISNNDKIVSGYIKLYPLAADSLAIQWQFEMLSSSNPVQRLKDYFYSKRLHKNFSHIIMSMTEFMQTPQNLYGFDVQQTTVTDTLLVATRTEINHYPHTEDVYKLVDKLKDYIKQSDAKETNQPMLHINQVDSIHFQYMVAIPVNKELPGQGDIQMKRMVPGNILVAEIRGGESTINHALNQFDNLISDYKQTSPAIPFQLLVTNRQEIRDTSRWITKLYYPIF